MDSGTFTVAALDVNPTAAPNIIVLTGSVGVATGSDSFAGAGMISVNLIQDETYASIQDSTIDQTATPSGAANVVVQSEDSAWIIAVGGAVGVGGEAGIGAAIAYNQIGAEGSFPGGTITGSQAFIEGATIDVLGSLSVTATATATIDTATLGVGVSTGDSSESKLAGGGSVSINQIDESDEAYITNVAATMTTPAVASNVTASAVTVQATDTSQIVSVAGGVAGRPRARPLARRSAST